MPVLTVELHRGGQRSASLPLGERREGTRPAPRSASCDGSDYGQLSVQKHHWLPEEQGQAEALVRHENHEVGSGRRRAQPERMGVDAFGQEGSRARKGDGAGVHVPPQFQATRSVGYGEIASVVHGRSAPTQNLSFKAVGPEAVQAQQPLCNAIQARAEGALQQGTFG